MSIASRPYHGEDDYVAMRALLTAILPLARPAAYGTVGDLDWWRFTDDDPEGIRIVQLWTNGDLLIGFAWPTDTEDEVTVVVHPDHHASLDRMFAWAEERQRANRGAEPTRLATWAFDGDTDRTAVLRCRGFEWTEDCYRYRRHHLAGIRPGSPLPPGYIIRDMSEATDAIIEQRVAVHRAAFAPSRMTVAKHRAVMAAPTYRPELDLIAVAPDGTFAAYCIVWLDPANRIGVFEPVGCHPDHQRRGLSRALLTEGMNRLSQLGAKTAFVDSWGQAMPANRLYESAGFQVVGQKHRWQKALSPRKPSRSG